MLPLHWYLSCFSQSDRIPVSLLQQRSTLASSHPNADPKGLHTHAHRVRGVQTEPNIANGSRGGCGFVKLDRMSSIIEIGKPIVYSCVLVVIAMGSVGPPTLLSVEGLVTYYVTENTGRVSSVATTPGTRSGASVIFASRYFGGIRPSIFMTASTALRPPL